MNLRLQKEAQKQKTVKKRTLATILWKSKKRKPQIAPSQPAFIGPIMKPQTLSPVVQQMNYREASDHVAQNGGAILIERNGKHDIIYRDSKDSVMHLQVTPNQQEPGYFVNLPNNQMGRFPDLNAVLKDFQKRAFYPARAQHDPVLPPPPPEGRRGPR